MAKSPLFVLVVLGLMSGVAAAQDARAVLQAASTAMGAANLKSIQYTGGGWIAAVGQNYEANADWPRFDMTNYVRTIDYEAKSSREELTRSQGNNPPRGGGGTPLQGEQRQIGVVSGDYAWNIQGANTNPAPAVAQVRQLEIWLTPHGFLKAAMAANPTAVSFTVAGPSQPNMTQNGGRMTVVSFTAFGKYRVNGTINDQNLVELVQTRIPNPVLGDMLYETRYTEYRDFGGVKFPTVLHTHQGDPRLNPGHNAMEVRVTNVQPNIPVAPVAVPDNVRQAKAAPVRVDPQKLADGIWLMAGGSHNSVAIEFRDFITVVEAPQNEARSVAVIEAVRTVIPGKPIRYVANTHHHFDHLGGLRTYVAEGVTVVTHQANRDFYDQVVFYPAPRTLEPDRLDTFFPLFSAQRRVDTKLVADKYEVTDGVRTLVLYPVEGLAHAADMLVAYLPKEKILVNADLYSPPGAGQPAPAPNASMRTLHQNIQRLKLDVAQHVPIHGQPGTMDAFLKVVGAEANQSGALP